MLPLFLKILKSHIYKFQKIMKLILNIVNDGKYKHVKNCITKFIVSLATKK
jgi:hypothetical protein